MRILLLALLFISSLLADAKSEAELRAQLLAAQKEKAALAAALVKLNVDGAARTAAIAQASKAAANGRTDAATSAAVNAAVADSAAVNQTVITQTAADKAADAAAKAQEAATKAAGGNNALLIVQSFGFVIVIVGFGYKALERRWDRAEQIRKEELVGKETIRKEGVADRQRMEALADARAAREAAESLVLTTAKASQFAAQTAQTQGAQLTQIHTLVNSSLTEAKESELQALDSYVALLEEVSAANQKLGLDPKVATLKLIQSTKDRIVNLRVQLADRAKETALAAKRLESELSKPPSDPKLP